MFQQFNTMYLSYVEVIQLVKVIIWAQNSIKALATVEVQMLPNNYGLLQPRSDLWGSRALCCGETYVYGSMHTSPQEKVFWPPELTNKKIEA